MSLITALNALQEQHGYLREEELRRLSAKQQIPLHAIQAVISFYPHFRTTPPAAAQVTICRDMTCYLAGSRRVGEQLKTSLSKADVEIHFVSCLGRCDTAPAVSVNDVPFRGQNVDTVIQAVQHPERLGQGCFTLSQKRWPGDPYANATERYGVIRRLRQGEPLDVLGMLKASELRGMGGAAFPTSVKWDLVRKQTAHTKYVICNADESEPGTFKDRVILAELPYLVLEGIMIAAHVVGAQKGYVFIRHEYAPERHILATEIDRARILGLFNEQFDIEIFVSPGGYILGEETALLECMEDKRGEPRNKPPFPGTHGLHNQPTVINNVETFAGTVTILKRGAEWWKAAGKNGCIGLKFISVSGHVNAPGVFQIPMGTTVRELIALAGGVQDGKKLKAFAPGGASSHFLPAEKVDTPIDFAALAKAGSMLGSGALLVVAEGTDMLDLSTNVVRFFRNESCGKCVPCRVGSEKAVAILEEMLAKGGESAQLMLLNDLAQTMAQTSICGLGQVALNPILSVMRHFSADVAKHVQSR
jgi:formate dehydrogenase/NADH-quinone oxidoreductase subunit F